MRTVLLIALLFSGMSATVPGQASQDLMDAPEAYAQSSEGNRLVIDVRSAAEWRETGVAEDAATITIHEPEGLPAFVEKILLRVEGRRDAPLALICATGVRSTYAKLLLENAGFTNVVNVKEGMLGSGSGPGWIKRGLPIESCNDC